MVPPQPPHLAVNLVTQNRHPCAIGIAPDGPDDAKTFAGLWTRESSGAAQRSNLSQESTQGMKGGRNGLVVAIRVPALPIYPTRSKPQSEARTKAGGRGKFSRYRPLVSRPLTASVAQTKRQATCDESWTINVFQFMVRSLLVSRSIFLKNATEHY